MCDLVTETVIHWGAPTQSHRYSNIIHQVQCDPNKLQNSQFLASIKRTSLNIGIIRCYIKGTFGSYSEDNIKIEKKKILKVVQSWGAGVNYDMKPPHTFRILRRDALSHKF